MKQKPFDRAKALFRSYVILDPFAVIVISGSTDTGYNFIPDHLTTLPTKLVKLVREKRLTDCLDWFSDNLGIEDQDAIAILRYFQGGTR